VTVLTIGVDPHGDVLTIELVLADFFFHVGITYDAQHSDK
jgi:hypothetical protein